MDQLSLIISFPPALLFIGGALLIPLFKGKIKSGFMLALPVLAFWAIATAASGSYWVFPVLDYDLVLGRVDALSRVFGYIFCIVTFLGVVFALNIDDDLQFCAAFAYAGGALGVTFAGDVFSLYIFWEIMAVASTFLILARRTRASQAAAMRYILVHIFGGLCLLAGIILYVQRTGTTQFGLMHLSGNRFLPYLSGYCGQRCHPASSPLAERRLSGGDRCRRRLLERLYHQECGLPDGSNVSGN